MFAPAYLEQERRALGEHSFNREYLGIPIGATASPFGWDLYERATQIRVPLVPPGRTLDHRLRRKPCRLQTRSRAFNTPE